MTCTNTGMVPVIKVDRSGEPYVIYNASNMCPRCELGSQSGSDHNDIRLRFVDGYATWINSDPIKRSGCSYANYVSYWLFEGLLKRYITSRNKAKLSERLGRLRGWISTP